MAMQWQPAHRPDFERPPLAEAVFDGQFEPVPGNRPPWLQELAGRLRELTSLPRGWDGYAGRPVPASIAGFVASLLGQLYVEGLDAPQLVPGGDGTVQIEWHINQYDLEIDVAAPHQATAVLYDTQNDSEREVEVEKDLTQLREWVQRIKQPRADAGQAEG